MTKRFTQQPKNFEPTQEEVDAVLFDLFSMLDADAAKASEADRLAREAHAMEMLEADALNDDPTEEDERRRDRININLEAGLWADGSNEYELRGMGN